MIKVKEIENEELRSYLSLANSKVLNNSDLVTSKDIGQDVVYHIAYRKMNKLVPNISKRAGETEDNTFLRVHTSTNLIGCITGFGNLFYDALFPQNKNFTNFLNNTVYVYTIPFEYAIKPSKTLVYDANITDELWLFPYNKDSRIIKPTYIEELKVLNIRIKPEDDKNYLMQITFNIKIAEGNYLYITKDKKIDSGSWTLVINKFYDNTHELVECKKGNLNIAYLSYQESNKPIYTKW